MSRRRIFLLFAVVALFLMVALWFSPGRNRHNNVWEKYYKIHEGMSKNDVVALFGVPPGKYNSRQVGICSNGQAESFTAVDKCCSKSVWLFDDGIFEIGFDKDLEVRKKVASANMIRPPGVWDRLMSYLGF